MCQLSGKLNPRPRVTRNHSDLRCESHDPYRWNVDFDEQSKKLLTGHNDDNFRPSIC